MAYQFEFEALGRAQRHGLGMGTGATPWREAGVKIEYVQKQRDDGYKIEAW